MLPSPTSLDQEVRDLIDLQLAVSRKKDPLPESASLKHIRRTRLRDTLDVDQVYLINLERRKDRLERMKYDLRFKVTVIIQGKVIMDADSDLDANRYQFFVLPATVSKNWGSSPN